MTREPLPTNEFNAGWEEGRHSADMEVGQLRAEVERLKEQFASLQASSGYEASIMQLEIERLKADHLSALKLSHEWMAKHDRLLAFIQARPEMLTELIAEEPIVCIPTTGMRPGLPPNSSPAERRDR